MPFGSSTFAINPQVLGNPVRRSLACLQVAIPLIDVEFTHECFLNIALLWPRYSSEVLHRGFRRVQAVFLGGRIQFRSPPFYNRMFPCKLPREQPFQSRVRELSDTLRAPERLRATLLSRFERRSPTLGKPKESSPSPTSVALG